MIDYRLDGAVAVVTHDDGKANVYTHDALDQLATALDKAEAEARALLLVGREGMYSAGFDLATMTASEESMRALVAHGARWLARLFTAPLPVVAACTGHALAAGALSLLVADVRIGTDAPAKIGLNEVAIGMPLPQFAVELARYRMPPSRFDTALLGRVTQPDGAVEAGFLDRTAPPTDVVGVALAEAEELAKLSTGAVGRTKRAARQGIADAFLATLDADLAGVGGPDS